MMEQVLNYVKSEHMLSPGDQVIVGFSGGADSVCLLFVLDEISKTMPIHLRAIHVNHELVKKKPKEMPVFVKNFVRNMELSFSWSRKIRKGTRQEVKKSLPRKQEEKFDMMPFKASKDTIGKESYG